MRIDAYTHFFPAKYFQALMDSKVPDIGKRVAEVPSIHNVDVRRKVVGHINLGYGIHACAGQALARIEGQAILNALIAKVKAIEPAGEPERAVNFQAHGHEHIPVRLIPA